jgi:putative ABC transport system ATP-binding protein
MSIAFENITASRRRPNGETLVILDRVSFAVPTGSRVAVIGPSGSGKTTLLRLMNRLDDPDEGAISLGGTNIGQVPTPELRRRVGMVFQQPHLFDATILDNLNRPLRLAGRPDLTRTDAARALSRVGLPEDLLDNHSRDLSVGQQQRVALARALVLEPEVLLLDEPTSALDLRSAEAILHLLVDLASDLGITVIMVSHTIDQAEMFADQILAVRGGEVRMYDSVSEAVAWALPVEAR